MADKYKTMYKIEMIKPLPAVGKMWMAYIGSMYMPLQLSNIRGDDINKLHELFTEHLQSFESRRNNGRDRFVAHIKKQGGELVFYNGLNSIDVEILKLTELNGS